MRRAVSFGLAVLIAVLLGASSLSAQSANSPPAVLPLFDGHIHYSRPDWSVYAPDRILGILEQAGIRRALVSSTPDDGTLALYAKDPKRIIPILRPYRTRDDMGTWWRDPSIVPYVEERLKRGVHRGIGEFHVSGRDIKTPVLKRIAGLPSPELTHEIVNVPSSAISIVVPVSSVMSRITAPPLPSNSRICSG